MYLTLKSYAPLHSTPDGTMVLPSEVTSVRKVVALGDLLVLNGMWVVGYSDVGTSFIEMPM